MRLPEPRPFIAPDHQRPKLANVLMLGIFSPYMVFIIVMSLCGLIVNAFKMIGGR